jgi:hypothetical protein
MTSYIYEYLYADDVDYARTQLKFYEHRLLEIEKSEINDSNKEIRRMRVNFLIYCIKYCYGF